MMHFPAMPAIPRDSLPKGFTRRQASAMPGASRSIIILVPSGVRSLGANPVPPVDTSNPEKPALIRRIAVATFSAPSAVSPRSTTSNPAASSCVARASPLASTREPATTPSETVRTFANKDSVCWPAAFTQPNVLGTPSSTRAPLTVPLVRAKQSGLKVVPSGNKR